MSLPPWLLGGLNQTLFPAPRHMPSSLCMEVNELFSSGNLQGLVPKLNTCCS